MGNNATSQEPFAMATCADRSLWFEAQIRLLKLERDAEKAEFELLTSEKVKRGQTKLLERMGISVGGLGVRQVTVGLGGKTIIELERPAQFHSDPQLPYHNFRPGMPAGIIDHNIATIKPSAKKSSEKEMRVAEGVVSKVTDVALSITVGSADERDQLELPARCRLIKLADVSTFDRLEFTMECLRRSCEAEGLCAPSARTPPEKDEKSSKSVGRQSSNATARAVPVLLTRLMRILLDIDPMEVSNEEMDSAPTPESASALNDSQKRAVRHALSSCPVTLVFGPPGTGKTHTLTTIIAELHARGDRVIVVAASNLAIDNIAERLLARGLPLTRLGHPARILDSLSRSTLEYQVNTSDQSEIIRDLKREINQNLEKLSSTTKNRLRGKARMEAYKDVRELRKDYKQRERGQAVAVLKSANIVCATAHGAGSHQMAHESFDVVVIDESTQACEAACWIPILKTRHKLILAGDPLQLPPTVKSMTRGSVQSTKTGKSAKPTSNKAKGGTTITSQGKVARTPSGYNAVSDADDATATSIPSDGKSKPLVPEKIISPPNPRRSMMECPRTLETTMFDRLLKRYPGICFLLNVQYRMHQTIMQFPSDELYQSKLQASDLVAQHLLRDMPHVTEESDDGLACPVLFMDTAGSYMYERRAEDSEGSILNENEAELVLQRINYLTDSGVLPEQILVISPYAAQVSHLNSLLKPKFPTLAVSSIDSCQGRETEAVIISLCRSNSEGVVGFLSEKRRLNVAMTRAKRHLTVIGDSDTLRKGSDFLKHWMDWLENNAEVQVVES